MILWLVWAYLAILWTVLEMPLLLLLLLLCSSIAMVHVMIHKAPTASTAVRTAAC